MEALTLNEKYLIEAIRSLNPFERIIIEANNRGLPNNFIIIRSTQVALTDEKPIFSKVYKNL